MASYDIDIRTDPHIADTFPVENVDLQQLRVEMAKFVGEMLKDHAKPNILCMLQDDDFACFL